MCDVLLKIANYTLRRSNVKNPLFDSASDVDYSKFDGRTSDVEYSTFDEGQYRIENRIESFCTPLFGAYTSFYAYTLAVQMYKALSVRCQRCTKKKKNKKNITLRCMVIGTFAVQFLHYIPLYRNTQQYATLN